MAYCIFLKSLRSLEEFRKNPCVQIPPKSRCANFQILGKFKNPIFYPKILLPIHFSLLAQLALPSHLAFGPVSPAGLPSPAGRRLPRRPIWPVCRRRLHRNTFSLLVHAFRAGRVFSHLSLSCGPQLSVLSPTPCWPTLAAPPLNPAMPGHPAPPSSAPQMAASRLNSPRHQDPLLNTPLNLPVMSGMDPHMIGGNLGWDFLLSFS
jgi:hypothetical protein